MIAADTNVLVRYLVADDPAQAALAAKALEAQERIFLSTIVLCELVWVLRRAYDYRRAEIVDVLRRLIDSDAIVMDRPAAERGLSSFSKGAYFADGAILAEADRAQAERIVTFDRRFAALSERVALLEP